VQQNLFSKGILAIMLFFTRHLNALDIISAIFGLLSAMLMYTKVKLSGHSGHNHQYGGSSPHGW